MKVLIIEDEPTIARILERKLKRKGFEVERVETISDAREKLELDFDIVFLDFVLKDGRAVDLLEGSKLYLVKHVVVMSAFMEEIDKAVFSKLNIIEFLIKPFDDIDGVLNKLKEL